jgi:hypothetical protein
MDVATTAHRSSETGASAAGRDWNGADKPHVADTQSVYAGSKREIYGGNANDALWTAGDQYLGWPAIPAASALRASWISSSGSIGIAEAMPIVMKPPT